MPPPALPYKLIATDLDGTLLRHDETVSERTRDGARRGHRGGCGAHRRHRPRRCPGPGTSSTALDYQGLAVCGQGAQVYHAGEHRLLTSVTLDRQLAGLALSKIEAETGPLLLAASRDGLEGEVLVAPGYRIQEGPLPNVMIDDPGELWAAPLNKVYLQHPTLDDDALARVAREVAGDLVGVTVSGEGIVELLPLGLTKATGLSLAARRLGITAKETLAFGDMPNDISMFAWAAHGVAMANAHDELKAVADEITASNEEDGIAIRPGAALPLRHPRGRRGHDSLTLQGPPARHEHLPRRPRRG